MTKPKIGGKIGLGLTLLEMGYEKLKESMKKTAKKKIKKQKNKPDVSNFERRRGVITGRITPVPGKMFGSPKKIIKKAAQGAGAIAGGAALGSLVPDGPIDKKNKRLMEEKKQQKKNKKKKVIKYPPPKNKKKAKKKVAVKKKKVIKYPPPKRK
tara:strand:- start:1796 stop:2257 length:462 start_codon:yes stop_codon:yes gene_type:complete